MEAMLYVSALIAAIAFAILVIYLVRTLKSANRTLEHVANTMAGLEKQINGITKETEELLHRTNRLADDIEEKTAALNGIFTSVKELGDSLGQVNRSIRHVSDVVSTQTVQQSDQIAKAVQWGNVAVNLFAKLKNKKQKDLTINEEEI